MQVCIDGPVQGWYVASYACPVGEMGDRFVGYYKVYPWRPCCFCEGGERAAGVSTGSFAAADAAIAAARRASDREIAGLVAAARALPQRAKAAFTLAA